MGASESEHGVHDAVRVVTHNAGFFAPVVLSLAFRV
jgi:hypothetical protein